MNKPPAFQFYADDFVAGVADLSAEEVGSYILLLCFQWGRGAIPESKPSVDRVAKSEVTPAVMAKFPDGKNPRLEAERQKQTEYRSMQSARGKVSAQARLRLASTELPTEGSTGGQPKGNSPSPSPSPLDAHYKSAPKLEDVQAFGQMRGLKPDDCEQFWHHFESMGWVDKNGNPVVKWQSKLMTWKATAQAAGGPPQSPGGKRHQPFVSELKTVLTAKQALRQRIYNRGHENALGFTARNDADQADLKVLNREIASLMDKIASTPV